MHRLRYRFSLVPLLAVATTLFSLVVFAGVGATELLRERQRLLEAAAHSADAAIALSQDPMAQALWNFDVDGLRNLARAMVREGGIVEVELRSLDSDRPVVVRRAGWTGAGRSTAREVKLFVPVRQTAIGTLRITESASNIDEQIKNQARSRLPLELLKVAAMALGLLLLLHRLVTRRLQSMVAALGRLQPDDLHSQLLLPPDASSSRDEIVVLAAALNRFHHAQAVEMLRRRQAEDHLREELLERSVILGSLRDALLTLDRAGLVRYVNPAASTLLGCPSQALIGATLAGIARVSPGAEHAEAEQDLTAWISSLQAGERSATVTVHPNAAAPFDAQVLINQLASGESALSIVIYDVSESSRREQAELAREKAEAASLAKSQFLSRMSHELRTPLNAIVGFAQSLEQDQAVSADAQRLAQVKLIGRAGWHLTRMIGDVLELSRIEAGSMRLDLHPLDVRPLVAAALGYLRAEATASQLDVETTIDADACHVLADPVRLEQVVINLISNAIKYNQPGGRVRVIAEGLDPHTVALRVRDTGLGMTPEQVSQLYQSFNRLGRESSSRPGTGIGLVITRALVELMGGRIELESVPGQGSTFSVMLPRAAAPGLAEVVVAADAASSNTEYRARHVVYVEDDPVNAQVMQALLARRTQIRLQIVSRLDDGWAAMQAAPPDLVLLDMQLPDGQGLDLLVRMRASSGLRNVPVLMVSADSMRESIEAALKAGAQAYITKPLDFEETLRQVDALLAELPVSNSSKPP
jgi:signal transduction histidine kinase/ActR/RegA family two-component response regulator